MINWELEIVNELIINGYRLKGFFRIPYITEIRKAV